MTIHIPTLNFIRIYYCNDRSYYRTTNELIIIITFIKGQLKYIVYNIIVRMCSCGHKQTIDMTSK